MEPFEIRFRHNGVVVGTYRDTENPPAGPLLCAGIPPHFPVAYEVLREMEGVSDGSLVEWRSFFIRRLGWRFRIPWMIYREMSLTLVGDAVLDQQASRFPVPPQRQIQVYSGTLRLAWASSAFFWFVPRGAGSVDLQGSVTLEYSCQPDAPIVGSGSGTMQPPILPRADSNVTATFNSEFPFPPGPPQPVPLRMNFGVLNFVLRGHWV